MADSEKKRTRRGPARAKEPSEEPFLYQGDESSGVTRTELFRPLPGLTPQERGILLALCAPILTGDALTSPAGVPEIAGEVGLGEADVEEALRILGEKFGLGPVDPGRLAIEAIRRGAVGLNDIRT